MPIKWNPILVKDAADMIEEYVKQAVEPLEQARIVAQEARKIPNLPQYVEQHFAHIQFEVGRAIGGDQFEQVGKLRIGIKAVRDSLPKEALEAEKKLGNQGEMKRLM